MHLGPPTTETMCRSAEDVEPYAISQTTKAILAPSSAVVVSTRSTGYTAFGLKRVFGRQPETQVETLEIHGESLDHRRRRDGVGERVTANPVSE